MEITGPCGVTDYNAYMVELRKGVLAFTHKEDSNTMWMEPGTWDIDAFCKREGKDPAIYRKTITMTRGGPTTFSGGWTCRDRCP